MKKTFLFPSFPNDCTSLLSKYLSKEVFEELKDKKTMAGFTLEQAINSGLENSDSGIGIYAGDIESYTTFSALFDPIIKDYHCFLISYRILLFYFYLVHQLL